MIDRQLWCGLFLIAALSSLAATDARSCWAISPELKEGEVVVHVRVSPRVDVPTHTGLGLERRILEKCGARQWTRITAEPIPRAPGLERTEFSVVDPETVLYVTYQYRIVAYDEEDGWVDAYNLCPRHPAELCAPWNGVDFSTWPNGLHHLGRGWFERTGEYGGEITPCDPDCVSPWGERVAVELFEEVLDGGGEGVFFGRYEVPPCDYIRYPSVVEFWPVECAVPVRTPSWGALKARW